MSSPPQSLLETNHDQTAERLAIKVTKPVAGRTIVQLSQNRTPRYCRLHALGIILVLPENQGVTLLMAKKEPASPLRP